MAGNRKKKHFRALCFLQNKDKEKTLQHAEDRRRNDTEVSCGQTVEPTRRPLGAADAAVANSIDLLPYLAMLRTCGHAEPLTQFWGWLRRVDAVTRLLLGYQGRGQEREEREERGASTTDYDSRAAGGCTY